MLRHATRAGAEVGQTLHRACAFLLTLSVMLSVAVFGGAWRLSKGPVNLAFLKNRVEQAVNSGIAPARMTIGGVSIAWRGFSHGLDQPLILRVTDLTVREAEGAAGIHIPVAEAALSARWLVLGRILPRAVTLEGPRLVLLRNEDGTVSFDIGNGAGDDTDVSPLTGLLAALGAPMETDLQAGGGRFSQLSAVSIHGSTLLLDDRLLGVTLAAERADVDLFRHKGGGTNRQATIVLVLGEQKAVLKGQFDMPRAARSVHVAASLSPVTPRTVAASVPLLAPFAALDVPLTLDGEADLGLDLTPAHLRLHASAGTGKVYTRTGSIPVRRAEFVVAGTPEQVSLERAVVELQPAHGAAISTLAGSGQIAHQGGRLTAALHLALDHTDFADLPALWPTDFSPPTRAWITENIPVGTAHDGKFDLVLEKADGAPDVALTKAVGTMEGEDIAVAWLTGVPRVEQAKAHLVLTDPDKVEIDVRSGRQTVNGADPIAIQSGHVTIVGLSQKDQTATVQCDASGSLPSAIALLKEPRLRILDAHPMDLRAPAGDVRMSLHAVVPLALKLQIDDVTIHGTCTLNKIHLTGISAGRDLDDATFALDVDTSHLALKGTGRVAGIPANIDAMMDFRSGPPSQALQRYTASGRATAGQLTDAGLDTQGALAGEVGLNLVFSEYRNGDGDLTADADLTQAELIVSPLGWRKPPGGAAKASARVTLTKDTMTGIDRLTIDGAGIQLRGGATASAGRLDTIRLDRAVLGRTDVSGAIRLPKGGPIAVDLAGPALDVAAKLQEKTAKQNPAAPPGPPWSMRGRFDRVFLAHDQNADQVAVAAENDGTVFHSLTVTGKSGPGKAFSMRITNVPVAGGHASRRLAIDVEDSGSLLHGLDVTNSIQGGVLTASGDFDDSARDHPLSGTLEISEFRVSHAQGLGKLLQAVTLYGLVDALGGPGLSFSQLTAPFQLNGDALVLRDARAFSPSLGLTAHGWIDRGGDRLDLEGTLVPAYVFNSLPGKIPLLGRLFSAEEGGGMFAMNYSLRGSTDNPTVVANPLSVVTPGILRGMFGIFDQSPTRPPPPPLDRETAGGNVQKP
jgi:hypothetical protein